MRPRPGVPDPGTIFTGRPGTLDAALGARKGWRKTAGTWTSKALDVTVEAITSSSFRVVHGATTRHLTSETGVLCWIDTLEATVGQADA